MVTGQGSVATGPKAVATGNEAVDQYKELIRKGDKPPDDFDVKSLLAKSQKDLKQYVTRTESNAKRWVNPGAKVDDDWKRALGMRQRA